MINEILCEIILNFILKKDGEKDREVLSYWTFISERNQC